MIAEDAAAHYPDNRPVLVFLGDYVDRGRDSRGVIDRLIELQGDPRFEIRVLKGNHEQQMLAFLKDPAAGPAWAEFGGAQTLLSYGVVPPRQRTDTEAWEAARLAFEQAVPAVHVDFLNALEMKAIYGDYVFVHAGLRPGIPLEEQSEDDLLWIREEFLDHPAAFEKIVVHGHTPETVPFLGERRIGVDTGAYATGRLTAARLFHDDREILQADPTRDGFAP